MSSERCFASEVGCHCLQVCIYVFDVLRYLCFLLPCHGTQGTYTGQILKACFRCEHDGDWSDLWRFWCHSWECLTMCGLKECFYFERHFSRWCYTVTKCLLPAALALEQAFCGLQLACSTGLGTRVRWIAACLFHWPWNKCSVDCGLPVPPALEQIFCGLQLACSTGLWTSVLWIAAYFIWNTAFTPLYNVYHFSLQVACSNITDQITRLSGTEKRRRSKNKVADMLLVVGENVIMRQWLWPWMMLAGLIHDAGDRLLETFAGFVWLCKLATSWFSFVSSFAAWLCVCV